MSPRILASKTFVSGLFILMSIGASACTIVSAGDGKKSTASGDDVISTSATGAGSGGHSSTGLTLTVTNALTASSIDGYPSAPANHTYLQVDVTLANQSIFGGVSESPVLFSVRMSSQVTISIASFSPEIPNACDASVTIQTGGTASCSLVFEIPSADTPLDIEYADPVTSATGSGTLPSIAQTCDTGSNNSTVPVCEACTACAQKNACKSEADAAYADPHINAYLACANACVDPECNDSCDQQYPSTASLVNAAHACDLQACPNDCALAG